jgi:hypothetical protein
LHGGAETYHETQSIAVFGLMNAINVSTIKVRKLKSTKAGWPLVV